jgi:hypothetical protein
MSIKSEPNMEINLLLQVKKKVTLNKHSTVSDLLDLGSDIFSSCSFSDFHFYAKEQELTYLGNSDLAKILSYYKPENIVLTPEKFSYGGMNFKTETDWSNKSLHARVINSGIDGYFESYNEAIADNRIYKHGIKDSFKPLKELKKKIKNINTKMQFDTKDISNLMDKTDNMINESRRLISDYSFTDSPLRRSKFVQKCSSTSETEHSSLSEYEREYYNSTIKELQDKFLTIDKKIYQKENEYEGKIEYLKNQICEYERIEKELLYDIDRLKLDLEEQRIMKTTFNKNLSLQKDEAVMKLTNECECLKRLILENETTFSQMKSYYETKITSLYSDMETLKHGTRKDSNLTKEYELLMEENKILKQEMYTLASKKNISVSCIQNNDCFSLLQNGKNKKIAIFKTLGFSILQTNCVNSKQLNSLQDEITHLNLSIKELNIKVQKQLSESSKYEGTITTLKLKSDERECLLEQYKEENNKLKEEIFKLTCKVSLQISEENFCKRYKKEAHQITNGITDLYRPYDGKSILRYDLVYREFTNVQFADYGDLDYHYNSTGTSYLNTIFGLFIITGENSNILFHFNPETKTVNRLAMLSDNHTNCSLIYYEKGNMLICLSGLNNRKVEYYINDDILRSRFVKSGQNREKNQWKYLPEMNLERSECAYAIVNDNLFAFFGFCGPQKKCLNSIECLNLLKPTKWEFIHYVNPNEFSLFIRGHSAIALSNNEILFLGGYDSHNEKPIEYLFEYYIEEMKMIPVNRRLKDIAKNVSYNFGKCSGFAWFEDDKERKVFVGYDDKDRVHMLDSSNLTYDIFYSD